jgi:hypothetical protein
MLTVATLLAVVNLRPGRRTPGGPKLMSFARDEPIFDGAADFDLELLESRTLDSAGDCYLGPKHIGAA